MAAQLKANARSLPELINMGIDGSHRALNCRDDSDPARHRQHCFTSRAHSRKMTDAGGRSVDDAILRQISRPPLGLGSARRLNGVHAGRQRAVRHRDAEYSRSRFVAERRPDETIGA